MVSVRPTLRCLRDDLSLPIPPLDRLLDEVDHPLLGKARDQFAAVRFVRRLEAFVPDLVRHSLRDGREHAADLGTFSVGVQVRADDGHETYVAIRIAGNVPGDLTKVILDIVPGCDHTGWYPEAALPDRELRANEQAWSNIMDTAVAAKLLDVD
jgi:hypothetical protein